MKFWQVDILLCQLKRKMRLGSFVWITYLPLLYKNCQKKIHKSQLYEKRHTYEFNVAT